MLYYCDTENKKIEIMTNDKLQEANNLSHDIRYSEDRVKSVRNCLKELSLSDYNTIDTGLRLDSKECQINTDRLISFLSNELETEIKDLKNLKEKFNKL